MRNVILALAFGVLVGGVGVRYALTHEAHDDERASIDALRDEVAAMRAEASSRAPRVASDARLESLVREGVRSELSEAAEHEVAVPSAPRAETTDAPSEPESDPVALGATLEVIDRARSSGRWTATEARAFRERLHVLPAPDQIEAVNQLALALNGGHVRVDPGMGAPF